VAAHAYLPRPQLERELGNGVHHALYRLAVMSQRSDDAVDLGQPLPAGLVDQVGCRSGGPRPRRGPWRWNCAVRWETPNGRPRRTAYAVSLSGAGCFAAAAMPQLPSRYDATIRSYSEDPLNTLTSARRGC
jgi:hypothetical protein